MSYLKNIATRRVLFEKYNKFLLECPECNNEMDNYIQLSENGDIDIKSTCVCGHQEIYFELGKFPE